MLKGWKTILFNVAIAIVGVLQAVDWIDVLGSDFIMFASDYPHWDGDWPESTKHLRSRADISDVSRRKIGGENARRFYGLA